MDHHLSLRLYVLLCFGTPHVMFGCDPRSSPIHHVVILVTFAYAGYGHIYPEISYLITAASTFSAKDSCGSRVLSQAICWGRLSRQVAGGDAEEPVSSKKDATRARRILSMAKRRGGR
jgi:hypothetical protein